MNMDQTSNDELSPESVEALRRYKELWNAQPWHDRLFGRVSWRAKTIWAAVRGRPTPEFHIAALMIREEREKNQILQQKINDLS